MYELAVERMSLPTSATASLGDRLDTDIAGGQRAGLKSILLLTGVTTRDMLSKATVQPDFVFENLIALTEAWGESVLIGASKHIKPRCHYCMTTR